MTEEQLQVQIADWCAACLPKPPDGPLWTAVNPLPGKSTEGQGARRKRLGLKPGWPDLQFLFRGQLIGVELKTPKGRLSVEQELVGQAIGDAGGVVFLARSLEEFQGVMRACRIPHRDRNAA